MILGTVKSISSVRSKFWAQIGYVEFQASDRLTKELRSTERKGEDWNDRVARKNNIAAGTRIYKLGS